MYRRVIKPVLFSLTIEQAHHAVLLLLRIIGLIPGGRWLLRKCYAVEHPALEREVFGIRFANPIGLAAGFDHNGEAFRELAALGFGFVEVGTVTPRPQAGNPRPRVFRLPKDNAIINRIGLANRGLETTIRHLRRPHDGVIVGCNIGKNTSTPRRERSGGLPQTLPQPLPVCGLFHRQHQLRQRLPRRRDAHARTYPCLLYTSPSPRD